MKEFIRKWSNWWILNPRRKQLDDAFEKELNELIEREVTLRIHDIVERREQLKAFLDEIANDKTYIKNDYYKNKAKRLSKSL